MKMRTKNTIRIVFLLVLAFAILSSGVFALDVGNWSSEIKVSSSTGLPSDPVTIADSSGNVYVFWQDNSGGNYDIVMSSYDSDGNRTLGPATIIGGASAATSPDAVFDSAGRINLVWVDERDGNKEIYYRLLYKNGSAIVSDTRVTNDVGQSIEPVINIKDGKVYVFWADNRTGHFEIYSDTIALSSPSLTVHSPANGSVSTSASVLLNATFSENVSMAWYTLDSVDSNSSYNTTNLTLTMQGIQIGSHNLTVFCRDELGNVNQSDVSFSVNTIPPQIYIISPESRVYYNTTSILVNLSNSSDAVSVWFNNGTANITYTGAANYTFREGSTNLTAYAREAAGSTNSTSVNFTIITIPTVNLTDSDADNYVSDSDAVIINATYSELMSTHTISINYADSSCADITNVVMGSAGTSKYNYSWNVPAGCDGDAVVTVAGTDLLGNAYSGIESITFTIDNTAPHSNITFPSNNYMSNLPLTVLGTANDSGSGISHVEFWNGSAWALASGTTSWSYLLGPAASGTVTVRSRVVDNVGNVESPTSGTNIVFDFDGPTISDISLDPNPASFSMAVSLSVRVIDANGVANVTAEVNGTPYVLANSGGNIYSTTITSPLVDASYPISMNATDTLGNTRVDSSASLVVDSTIAIISVSMSNNTVDSNGTMIFINVTNADTSYYNTSANSTPTPIFGADFFAMTGLEGNFTLYIWANSSSSAVSEKTFNYVIDDTPPTLIILPPTTPTNNASTDISGTFNDSNIDYITVNGGLASIIASTWLRSLLLSEGNNSITVIAYDKAGQSGTENTSIYLDSQTPTSSGNITGTPDAGGWYDTDITITLSGDDGATSSGFNILYCNVSACTPSIIYTGPVNITAEGAATFRYAAEDAAGNGEAVHTMAFSIDKSNPSVSGLNISPSAPGVNVPVVISATVTDANLNTVIVSINGTNYTMSNTGGNTYAYTFTPTQASDYLARVYATDLPGKVNDSALLLFTAAPQNTTQQNTSGSQEVNYSYSGSVVTVMTNGSSSFNLTVTRYEDEPAGVTQLPQEMRFYDVDMSNMVNVSWMVVKLYYLASEVTSLNWVESSIHIVWYDDSSGSWITLSTSNPSWVNGIGIDTTNDYVWLNTSRDALFGITGTVYVGGGSGGGGGGGGGSSGAPKPVVCTPSTTCGVWSGCVNNFRSANCVTQDEKCNIVRNVQSKPCVPSELMNLINIAKKKQAVAEEPAQAVQSDAQAGKKLQQTSDSKTKKISKKLSDTVTQVKDSPGMSIATIVFIVIAVLVVVMVIVYRRIRKGPTPF